jgi:hypothetical protein
MALPVRWEKAEDFMTPSEPSLSTMRPRRATRRAPNATFAVVALLLIAFAPVTLAQTGDDSGSSSAAPTTKKHKKKGTKPAPTASDAPSAAPPPAEPTPTAAPETTPAPSAEPSASAAAPTVPNTPPEERWDISDTHEDPNKRYLFVGLRYRGTIIPQFFENIFVDNGGTIYSNSFAIELDIRKGGQSTIPWIEYDDYTTGNMLFHQKGQALNDAAFYSVVKSSLKAIYLGIDERWSIGLVPDKLDYEYGFGVGIGAVFGDLHNGWVTDSPNNDPTPLSAKVNGQTTYFIPCSNTGQGRGCAIGDHQSATVAKINGYVEPNWFNGGSVPTIFPHISIVPLSLRYKPIKMLEMRAALGIQLTGFFFSIGVDYGLEQKPEEVHKASRDDARLRDTL